jgi:hypothetical protein
MILPKRFAPSSDVMLYSRQSIEASAIVLSGADGLNIANDTQIAGGGAVVTQPIYVAGFNWFKLVLQAGDVSASLVMLDPQDNATELYEYAMGSASNNGGISQLQLELHGMHTIKLKISNNSPSAVNSIGTIWGLVLSKI